VSKYSSHCAPLIRQAIPGGGNVEEKHSCSLFDRSAAVNQRGVAISSAAAEWPMAHSYWIDDYESFRAHWLNIVSV